MLVREWMTTVLVTVSPDAPVAEAQHLMRHGRIRHLPVVERGRLAGIITDRDVRTTLLSPATSLAVGEIRYLLDRLLVERVMNRSVITIGPDAPMVDAVRLMLDHRIGALPVVEGDRSLRDRGATAPSTPAKDRPGSWCGGAACRPWTEKCTISSVQISWRKGGLMIGVLTHHWAKVDRVEAAKNLLDANGLAQSKAPGFVSRQTLYSTGDPTKITTLVVWTSNDIYDHWRASPERAVAMKGAEELWSKAPESERFHVA
jgi:CBS domain-containing protein/heme-degrading monooxygenase HmoA